jgi:hypothetical protein
MKEVLTGIAVFIIGLMVLVAIAIGGKFLNLWSFSYSEPKIENARREVFENTKSYNEGKIQELVKYRLEYMRGDEVTKKAIASTLRHTLADFDKSKLSDELYQFIEEIKYK